MIRLILFLLLLSLPAFAQQGFYPAPYNYAGLNVATSGGGGGGGTVTGTGTAPQCAYWTSTSGLSGDAGCTYNATTDVITLNGGLLATSPTGFVSATFGLFAGVSGTIISATQSTYTPILLIGGQTVSLTGAFDMNKQTGVSSINGRISESPGGITARMYADSACAELNRNGAAAIQLSLCATGFGFGTTSTANASVTVIGDISATGINLSSPTTAPTCNAGRSGYVFYNNTTKCLNYCDGTAYRQVTSLAASCT